MRAAEARRKRRQRLLIGAGAVVVVAAIAVGITLAVSNGGSPAATGGASTPKLKLASLSTLGTLHPAPSAGPKGPEQVPIPGAAPLTGTSTKATGQKVDGIGCDTSEQVLFHIHAHLTIFVNGSPRQVPAGIGIPGAKAQNTPQGSFIGSGNCFYWLHVHAGRLLRRVGPAARDRPGRPGSGPRHSDLQRPPVPGQPARHPARQARPDPARGGHPTGRAGTDHLARRAIAARRHQGSLLSCAVRRE